MGSTSWVVLLPPLIPGSFWTTSGGHSHTTPIVSLKPSSLLLALGFHFNSPTCLESYPPCNWLPSGFPDRGLTFCTVGEETASRDNNLKELEALSLEETSLKENVFRDDCTGKQFNIWGLGERVLKSDLIVTPDPILTNCVASKSLTDCFLTRKMG